MLHNVYLFFCATVISNAWHIAIAEVSHTNCSSVSISKRDTSSGVCFIPEPLTHGSYQTHHRRCPGSDQSAACRLVPGTTVPDNWLLFYNCETGYQLAGLARASICRNGQWSPSLPTCVPQLVIVNREGWGAEKDRPEFTTHSLPLRRVIIQHTATDLCITKSDCILTVQSIQQYQKQSIGDIGYNFLVGGDGSVFEGQGWTHVGAHTINYNTGSIGVALIGNFVSKAAPEPMLTAVQRLIQFGLANNKIAVDYQLFAHCQLIQIASPGRQVFNVIRNWPHWESMKALQCIS